MKETFEQTKPEKQPELITPEKILEHIEGNEELQKELYGKSLTKEEVKSRVNSGLTTDNVVKIMNSMGMRPATFKELQAWKEKGADMKDKD